MESNFTIPQELQMSFQRLIPYMSPGLRSDEQGLASVLLYLKLGGERLARIVIDAYNQTHRLQDVAEQKLRLEEMLLAKQMADEADENDGDDEEEEEEGDDDDDDEEKEASDY